jgi:putative endonuclease
MGTVYHAVSATLGGMTNYSSGHHAEKLAADYLIQNGYEIIALNWKVKRAEIDIVARKKRRFGTKHPLVFVEVKHRKTTSQGTGFDYITPKKISQMQFAAELYVTATNYKGEYSLGAIELNGEDYVVSAYIDSIT